MIGGIVIKTVIASAIALMLLFSGASAQTCSSVPNTLTNGTTADATQVMADFNAVISCLGGLRGYLGGLIMSNDSTSPNALIDTSAGVADSDDATALMTLATAFTKNTNAAWASGTGSGCLDSGAALTANTWYHLFIVKNPASNTVDELCSQSATSPALPSGYTKKRRIGSFRTNSSADIMAFSQNGDEFLWVTPVADVNGATTVGGDSLHTLTVPTGIKVNALFIGQVTYQSGPTWGNFWSPDSGDSSAGSTLLAPIANTSTGGEYNVRTNTSGQVYSTFNGAGSIYYINTFGWIDRRGRFN